MQAFKIRSLSKFAHSRAKKTAHPLRKGMSKEIIAMRHIVNVIVIIALSVIGVVSVSLMFTPLTLVGWVALAINAVYLRKSYTVVPLDKVGAMTLFGGASIGDVVAGWYFTPLWIVKIKQGRGTAVQDELPDEPQNIFRGDGPMPQDKVPPIRIKFGPPPANPTDPIDIALQLDPYNKEMVTEVVPVVAWYISRPTTFFTKIGTEENCRKMLADLTVSTFGDEFAKVTPAKAALTLKKTSAEMMAELVTKTATWGITIDEAFIKPFIFSHSLNLAVEGTSIADLDATALVSKTTGEAKAIRINASARAEELIRTGRAKGHKTTGPDGDVWEITELIPDANIRVLSQAIEKHNGTLVLGGDTNTMLGINDSKGGK